MNNENDVQKAKEEIKKSADLALARYLQEIRTNPSSQADDVIEKIQNGGELKDSDIFILTNTDQKRIDKAVKLDEIKDKMNKGRLSHKDVDFLVDTLGDIKEFDQSLRQAFYRKADEVNFAYAVNHKDEFTKEEFLHISKQLLTTQPIQEILEDNLRQK